MNNTLKGAIALTIMTAVLLLGAGIYFFTLYLAYLTSFGSLLLALFIPVLGQLYWLWIVWGTTGVFFNWFTIACLVWLGLVVGLAVLAKTSNRRAMISREALLDKDHDRFWALAAAIAGDCGRARGCQ